MVNEPQWPRHCEWFTDWQTLNLSNGKDRNGGGEKEFIETKWQNVCLWSEPVNEFNICSRRLCWICFLPGIIQCFGSHSNRNWIEQSADESFLNDDWWEKLCERGHQNHHLICNDKNSIGRTKIRWVLSGVRGGSPIKLLIMFFKFVNERRQVDCRCVQHWWIHTSSTSHSFGSRSNQPTKQSNCNEMNVNDVLVCFQNHWNDLNKCDVCWRWCLVFYRKFCL